MRLLVRWLINAMSLLIVAYVVPGFELHGFGAALIAAVSSACKRDARAVPQSRHLPLDDLYLRLVPHRHQRHLAQDGSVCYSGIHCPYLESRLDRRDCPQPGLGFSALADQR